MNVLFCLDKWETIVHRCNKQNTVIGVSVKQKRWRNDMDFCECCGVVEVFDGKVCRECKERINRALAGAIDNFNDNMYNEEGAA